MQEYRPRKTLLRKYVNCAARCVTTQLKTIPLSVAVSQGLKKMYGCEKQPTLQGLRSWVERSIKEIDGTLDKCALQV